jgi:hypothetical protein
LRQRRGIADVQDLSRVDWITRSPRIIWQPFNLAINAFHFFFLAILLLLMEDSFELLTPALLFPETLSKLFSFLAPLVALTVIFSSPALARSYWYLSLGVNCSGSLDGILGDVHFNLFLFLNQSISLVQGHLIFAPRSRMFISIVIHPSGN